LCAKEIITIQTGNTHTSIENRKKRRSFCEATTAKFSPLQKVKQRPWEVVYKIKFGCWCE